MERLPWQVRNRRQSQLSTTTDHYATDEDFLYKGHNVKFNQLESETEMDEQIVDKTYSKKKKHQRKK